MPGISRRTRVYLEITLRPPGYFVDFLNFASDFAPDQLSDSGKLASFPRETREKQNGAPNTLWFPWKLPETQSAGDPLVSLWVAGNPRTGQSPPTPRSSVTTHKLFQGLTEMYCQNFVQTNVLARGPHTHNDYQSRLRVKGKNRAAAERFLQNRAAAVRNCADAVPEW